MLRWPYNQKVKPRLFNKGNKGEMILKQVLQNIEVSDEGKWGPTWEGPYIIESSNKDGSY